MRFGLTTIAMLLAIAINPVAKGEDKAPQGSIGIKIMADEGDAGKITIIEVIKDSPAEKAGLKADDVLVKINDVVPKDVHAAVEEIVSKKPGTKVNILVKRGDKEMKIEVTVGKRPEVIKE